MKVEKWWNEICGRWKREKPREKPNQIPFRPPRNPLGGTETRTRDPSGGRRAPNCLCHEAAFQLVIFCLRCNTDHRKVLCSLKSIQDHKLVIIESYIEISPVILEQWCPKLNEGGWVDFPLSTSCILQSTLPLSMSLLRIALVACLCVSYDNRHRIACLLPSLTTLDYYLVLILRVAATIDLYDDARLVERGIYTDYVIISKETSLGITAV